MNKYFTLLIIVFLGFSSLAQVPVATFEMKSDNFKQLDETRISWEMWVRKASGEDFGLYGWQFQWDFNSQILNTGEFTTAAFTVVPGADGGIFMGHYNNDDVVTNGIIFSHGTTSFPGIGGSMTLITSEWKHIATYTAQLTKNGNPHNFSADDIEFAHRVGGVVELFASTIPHATGNNDQINGTLFTAPGVPINDRELASHWFSGSGNWTDAARWNNVTTENANTVPGAGLNVGISGTASISDAINLSEVTVSSATVNLPAVSTGTGQWFGPGLVNTTGHNVTSADALVAKGVLFGPTGNEVITDAPVVVPEGTTGTGSWNQFVNNGGILSDSWYYRAYATNANGTAYGDARLISNNATIGAPATGGAVQVNGSLVISESGSLTASQLFNDADESAITLLSSASGTGTLIHGNTGVQASMQRYMPGAAAAWHGISAPVSSMDILTSDWYPAADEDLYLWNEASPGTWVNVKNQDGSGGNPSFPVANGGNNFAMGRGYIVNYNSANPVKNFVGTLNAGTLNIPLDYNSSKSWSWEAGWNLVGNPYASGLDFNAITKTNLAENYAQIYDPNKPGGEGYVTATTIAPGQAFYVKAGGAGASLGLETADQVHGGTFYKSHTGLNDNLVLRLSNGLYYDETTVLLQENSDPGYDFYDASKLYSFNTQVPQISSRAAERSLHISSIPFVNQNTILPLRLLIPADGEYSLQAQTIEGAFEQELLYVEDVETGLIHDLKESAYSFSAQSGETDRLVLLFGLVGLSEANDLLIKTWYANELIHISGLEGKYKLSISDLTGRQIYAADRQMQELTQLQLSLEPGIYILNIQGLNKQHSVKIQVN